VKQGKLDRLIKQTARKLRREQTESETMLWQILRDRKLSGIKFLRQHPILLYLEGKQRFFIADFYCHEAGLIVELDGAIHMQRKDYDNARDHVLQGLGLRIIRIKNQDIKDNPQKVINVIKKEICCPAGSLPSLTKRGE